MPMFSNTGGVPGGADALICSILGGSYTMQPGQTETGPIRVRVTAIKMSTREGAPGYAGQAVLTAQGEVVRLVGPVIVTLNGGVGEADVKFTNLDPRFADANGVIAVGVVAYDYTNNITGSSQSFGIKLAAPPVKTTHRWEFFNHGRSEGWLDIAEPEDVSLRRDGQLMFPNYSGGFR